MSKDQDLYGEKDIQRRMEDAIKRAQKTPPKSLKDIAGKRGKIPKRKAKKG